MTGLKIESICIVLLSTFLLAKGATVDISNAPVIVNCTATSANVDDVYSWSFNGKVMTNATGYSLNISDAKQVGQYNCTVNGNTYTHDAVNFSSPSIEYHGKSITLYRGAVDQSLGCHSYSVPAPTFTWFRQKENSEVVTQLISGMAQSPYSIHTSGPESTLTISTVTENERGTYTCSASNIAVPSGQNATVKVRIHDNMRALWPFLGIVCETLLLAVIMIIYNKHQQIKDRKKSLQTSPQKSDSTVRFKDVQSAE